MDMEDLDKYYCKILKEKDQRIAELEEQLKTKEEEHEQLIRDFEKETENLRKQIKTEHDARQRFVLKVKELEEEIRQLKALLNADNKMKTNSLTGFEKLQEENAKLQEQLKNAIVPKFNVGQQVWVFCDNEILQGEVSGIFLDGMFPYDMRYFFRIKLDKKWIADFKEDYIFDTKAEAEKFLESLK